MRRALWSSVPALLLLVLPTAVAGAQGERPGLERSRPRNGAVVHRAPKEVELTFSRPVGGDLLTVSVLDACSQDVGTGLTVSGARATVPLETKSKGRYTVVYEVVTDGGPQQEVVEFKVHAGPRCTQASAAGGGDAGAQHGGGHGGRARGAAAQSTPADEAGGGAVAAAVGISLGLGVLGGWLLRITDAR